METFVYWQLQNKPNILFTVISFSVLHRSFERGQQGYKFNKHEARLRAYVYANTGNFSSLPSAFSLCGAVTAEQLRCMPSTQRRVSPPDVFRQLLIQPNCWLPGPFPLWQQRCHRRQSLQLSSFFPPTSLKREFSSFPQSDLGSHNRAGRKHFCQQKTQTRPQCSVVKLFRMGWHTGRTSTATNIKAWNTKSPKRPALPHCLDPF